jgi:hypothetical protein
MIQQAWRCDDLLVLATAGYAGTECIYDSTSHQLVGVYEGSDVPTFSGDAFHKTAGHLPSDTCTTTVDRIDRTCPASGVVDGGR